MSFNTFTMRLSRAQRVIEIIADQLNLNRIAAKNTGLFDLLLRRRHRHKNRTVHIKMFTHIGYTLGVVTGARTNKIPFVGIIAYDLAHCVKCAAQFVGSYRRKIFAFEPNLRIIFLG